MPILMLYIVSAPRYKQVETTSRFDFSDPAWKSNCDPSSLPPVYHFSPPFSGKFGRSASNHSGQTRSFWEIQFR